ncbi:hypothetical protein BHE74_00030308 [Ensete ventricosum]|nr:hypothetical protein BHE74_00030308 [Ensete ventricosum]RZS01880.1 hypothetical protein BHM03_00031824 [Ensete ventricosum]
MNFSELSINVLVLRRSKVTQELSLELSPRRDSVIGLGKEGTAESKGCRGCSGSKEAATGKKGEEERWQMRLRQRRGCAAEITAAGGNKGRGRVPAAVGEDFGCGCDCWSRGAVTRLGAGSERRKGDGGQEEKEAAGFDEGCGNGRAVGSGRWRQWQGGKEQSG